MEKFPIFTFSGSPIQLGLAHGEQLKDRIHETWDFYRSLLNADEETVAGLSLRFAKFIHRFSPSLAEEIEAIAEAAGMPPWQLYALNSRTELIRTLNMPPECTVFCLKEQSTIAQTWDWAGAFEKLAVVLELQKADGQKILTMTEPGIVGKIGLNSNGIGVGISIMKRPLRELGLPVHVLLRSLLEASSLEKAEQIIQSSGISTNSNIVLADVHGSALGFEISDTKIQSYGKDDSAFVHTNHYLALDVENIIDEDFESSDKRIKRGRELLQAGPPASLAELQQLLLDKKNGDHAICHEIVPDTVIGSVGTLCALILDLPCRTLHITPGSPLKHEFARYSFSTI